MITRSDLRKLALLRLKEGKLLDEKCYSGAYYLVGYTIECALKACIAKKVRRGEFPDKKTVEDSYTHDLEKLIRVAELETELNKKKENNRIFEVRWNTVKDWSEQSRYEIRSRKEAEDLLRAISDSGGVFPWIQRYW